MPIFRNERIWRFLTNFWTVVTIIFSIFNFFTRNAFHSLFAPLSVIYVGILGIFVGTKEFERWYANQRDGSRHPGEWFVIAWSIVMFSLFLVAWFDSGYSVSPELVAVYIAVLSIFAITQQSKHYHFLRHEKSVRRGRGVK